jgi:hypothetical protein
MLPHQKKYATIFYCQKCAKELREREKEWEYLISLAKYQLP